MAARKVQWPVPSSQVVPVEGLTSASVVELTVKVTWAGGNVRGEAAKNGCTLCPVAACGCASECGATVCGTTCADAAPAAVGVVASMASGAINSATLKIPPKSVRMRLEELAIT